MIDYSKITSGIIQRGEELFSMGFQAADRDWNRVAYFIEKIPGGGKRLMSMEEVLELYD